VKPCPILGLALVIGLTTSPTSFADDPLAAAREVEQALHLKPDLANGRKVYLVCSVCHQPEGWGTADGTYPQIAGQYAEVTIKQLADIRARNRDNPIMLPFAMTNSLTIQDIADVSYYIEHFPMDPNNGVGPGTDLELGQRLYEENCVDCHGERGQGVPEKHSPLLQGQHYRYLVRQFELIRDGKRLNADKEMVKQIQSFSTRDIQAVMDYTSRLKPPLEMVALPGYTNPDFPRFWRPITSRGPELGMGPGMGMGMGRGMGMTLAD
jgi:cytochrome c553